MVYIETPVDKLVKLVHQKGCLPLSTAVKIIQVEEDIVMEWLKILEKSSIIKIKYSMFKEPEIIKCS